jgi:hypothetical protein
MTTDLNTLNFTGASAVLDLAHLGDIEGGLGTIRIGDDAPRKIVGRLRTLLAIVGPDWIVMVGDNDAGASVLHPGRLKTTATTLLWTLPLLVPVLFCHARKWCCGWSSPPVSLTHA